MVDITRQTIIDKYNPDEEDFHLKVLSSAHINEDDYFLHMVQDDIAPVINDIKLVHAKDSESAPATTIGEELKKDLEDVANFNGSPLEKQAYLYCKKLGIRYKNLSSNEFYQLTKYWKNHLI